MVHVFIQVIQGRTGDADGLHRQIEKWQSELAEGADGYLGATGGVADDGTVVFLVRFDSAEDARANSERPEQGEWWRETAELFDGEVTFRDCDDAETTFDGGSDDAGFVQVMQGQARDKVRLRELETEFLPKLAELRPDIIGSVRGWDGDLFTEAIYFTNETDARKGEASMEEATGEELEEYLSLVGDVTYIDLKTPWFHSP